MSAITNPSESEPWRIQVAQVDRASAGSCNNCKERESDKVFIIHFERLSFRVCRDCAKQLLNGLHKALIT